MLAYNALCHEHLGGEAPLDVEGNKPAHFGLQSKASRDRDTQT